MNLPHLNWALSQHSFFAEIGSFDRQQVYHDACSDPLEVRTFRIIRVVKRTERFIVSLGTRAGERELQLIQIEPASKLWESLGENALLMTSSFVCSGRIFKILKGLDLDALE